MRIQGVAGWLLGFAAVTALLGLVLVATSAPVLTLSGIGEELRLRAELAFAPAAWSWLVRITVGAVALAVGLRVLLALLSIPASRERLEFAAGSHETVQEAVAETRNRVGSLSALKEPDIIGIVNELVRGAANVQASDVHMSPTTEGFRLTYRVSGTLFEVCVLPPRFAPLLATRVKVMSRLDTYVRNVPQDGRMVVEVEGGSVEARVSTLPAEGGERIVLRLVRGSRTPPDVESLGLSPHVIAPLRELLEKPQGLLFVCGPVGSGKTTTLYAVLKHISHTRGRTMTMVTLEDPIELELAFATQTQINTKTQMTFARTLRSVLRQDPNVLMLGEIRDPETAGIAIQAGLTGHLILTTVHAENAAAPFARMTEMGVESYAIASATLGCLSQRLVRLLCTHCRKEKAPDNAQRERFLKHGITLPKATFYEAVGCSFCEDQGFSGQAPIAELLVVTPELRKLILERVPTSVLFEQAMVQGMRPLLLEGVLRAAAGETSLTEVLRAAG
ncbi:MAG: GspE/PulE family protein [Polyangiaceae bacterium]|nr:GspE/PulE family protein [Polyangiaceae bacterium]